MAAQLRELVWVAVLLDSCPDVGVLSVRVETDEVPSGGEWVPAITLDIHAGSQADAIRLALALRLREVEGRVTESEFLGRSEWRAFRGWVADGSRDAAVLVKVTGADPVYAGAMA